MSTFTEDGGNYFAERPTIELPDLSPDDGQPDRFPATPDETCPNGCHRWGAIWLPMSTCAAHMPAATCQGCGVELTDDTTACVTCDLCHDCMPGTCVECRVIARDRDDDFAYRAARDAS